jgi:hypothetical protein
MSEPHDVVKLLAARMESHPEEFEDGLSHRWGVWMSRLAPFVTEAERVLLRGPVMQDIHEEVLDELMNGPERRAEEQRKRDEEVQRHIAQQQAAQQHQLQRYQNAVGQRGVYDVDRDMYRNAQTLGLSGQSPMVTSGTLTTQPTLSKSAINQIKQALGIKK